MSHKWRTLCSSFKILFYRHFSFIFSGIAFFWPFLITFHNSFTACTQAHQGTSRTTHCHPICQKEHAHQQPAEEFNFWSYYCTIPPYQLFCPSKAHTSLFGWSNWWSAIFTSAHVIFWCDIPMLSHRSRHLGLWLRTVIIKVGRREGWQFSIFSFNFSKIFRIFLNILPIDFHLIQAAIRISFAEVA